MQYCSNCARHLDANGICVCTDPHYMQHAEASSQQPYSPHDPHQHQAYPHDLYQQQGHPHDPYQQQAYPHDPHQQQGYPPPPPAPPGQPYQQGPYPPHYPGMVPPTPTKRKRPPGQVMIRVVGIITTVFAVLEFNDIATVFELHLMPDVSYGGMFSAIAMIMILGMGIFGIVCAGDRSKALIILSFGIAILATMITIELIGAGNNAFIMFAPLGVLYIVGAIRRKNAHV